MQQDRFKFRVFYENKSEMLFVYSFDKDFIRATSDLVVPSIRHIATRDCILMQCTGLKDKNSKLIYEGDIVKFKNFDNKYYIGTIRYTNEDALFCLSYTNENNKQDWDYVSRYKLEVIGNIYENPELLEA